MIVFPIDRDKVAEGEGLQYEPPHWVDEKGDLAPDRQYPAAYRREAKMVVTAEFWWCGGEGLGQTLVVKGDGPGGHDFYRQFNVDDPNDPHDSLTVDGFMLRLVDSAAGTFADTIEHFDTFDIDWSISVDGGASWMAAGTTKNQVYTLLESPVTTLFRTVAHIATEPAVGLDDPQAVVDAVWTNFAIAGGANAGLLRLDGVRMVYSHLKDEEGLPLVAFDAAGMLSHDQGLGQCTAWADLFVHAVGAHGINAVRPSIVALSPFPERNTRDLQ